MIEILSVEDTAGTRGVDFRKERENIDCLQARLSPSAKQRRNPSSETPHVFQDLSTRLDRLATG